MHFYIAEIKLCKTSDASLISTVLSKDYKNIKQDEGRNARRSEPKRTSFPRSRGNSGSNFHAFVNRKHRDACMEGCK